MASRATALNDGGGDPAQNYTKDQEQQHTQQQVLPRSNDSNKLLGENQQYQPDTTSTDYSGKQNVEENAGPGPGPGDGDGDDTMELEDDNFSAATTRAVRASSSHYFSTRQLQDRDVGSVTGTSFVLPLVPLNTSNPNDAGPATGPQQQQQQQQLQLQRRQSQDQQSQWQQQQQQGQRPPSSALMGPPIAAQQAEEQMMLEDDDDISTLTEYSMEEDEEDNNSQTTSQTSISQTTSVVTTATDSTTVPTSHIFPGNGGPVQGQYPREHLPNRTKRGMVHDNQLSNSQFKRRKRS